eukprot:m.263633 g.263633  ORF g.263633 m.263633 type:complete len:472 (+) comp16011_c1_seq3:193-1608(+)
MPRRAGVPPRTRTISEPSESIKHTDTRGVTFDLDQNTLKIYTPPRRRKRLEKLGDQRFDGSGIDLGAWLRAANTKRESPDSGEGDDLTMVPKSIEVTTVAADKPVSGPEDTNEEKPVQTSETVATSATPPSDIPSDAHTTLAKKKKKKKKQKEVRKIALADLNTHELRSLLDAHGITYHHVNSRADLEALCNGLEVKGPAIGTPLTSGSSLASMKSGTSIDTVASNDSGAVSPGPSLLPPSTADLLPPAPSSLLPPSAKASTKDSGGGGMNLFNKYKAKAGSPVGGGLLAPAPPRGRSSSARMAREDSKPSAPTQTAKSTDDIQISSPKPPANDATSEASNGESKRLSEMAADFFGGLFAEANGGDGPASPGPVLASVAEAPQTASQPARIETGDTTDDSDDSGSDTTDSDDDDDSSDDSDDGNSRAHSTEFMKKLASGPPAGRPPPPANSAAAERAAKRKEKLRAMAQGL